MGRLLIDFNRSAFGIDGTVSREALTGDFAGLFFGNDVVETKFDPFKN